MSKPELPNILPCAICGGSKQELESSRPEGRQKDIWRVVCKCGHAPLRWSISVSSAIRLWNQHMSNADDTAIRSR